MMMGEQFSNMHEMNHLMNGFDSIERLVVMNRNDMHWREEKPQLNTQLSILRIIRENVCHRIFSSVCEHETC